MSNNVTLLNLLDFVKSEVEKMHSTEYSARAVIHAANIARMNEIHNTLLLLEEIDREYDALEVCSKVKQAIKITKDRLIEANVAVKEGEQKS